MDLNQKTYKDELEKRYKYWTKEYKDINLSLSRTLGSFNIDHMSQQEQKHFSQAVAKWVWSLYI